MYSMSRRRRGCLRPQGCASRDPGGVRCRACAQSNITCVAPDLELYELSSAADSSSSVMHWGTSLAQCLSSPFAVIASIQVPTV